jgi:6-phosphogluconolactonase
MLRTALPLFAAASLTAAEPWRLYLGSSADATAPRILVCDLDRESGALTVRAPAGGIAAPSYLALNADGTRLYAVSGDHHAVAYRVDGTSLTELNRSAVDKHPCHLAVSPDGRALLVANYSGGSTSALPIAADGTIGAATTVAHQGSGPHPKRQQKAYAHGVAFVAAADGVRVLVADLGADRVFTYRLDAVATLTADAALSTAPGAGPRHVAVRGDRIYAVNELDNTVSAWTWDAASARATPLATVPTLPADFTAPNTAAGIAVTPDGRHLYASNRGQDALAVFTLDAEGRPVPAGHIPVGGKTPRGFGLSPDGAWIVVGNQNSDQVVVLRRDAATGLATPVGAPLAMAKPTCAVFAPR